MFKICDALHASSIFNSRNVCIKFGDRIVEGDNAIFNGTFSDWADSVLRLDNYIIFHALI